jgi:hypothetical protein
VGGKLAQLGARLIDGVAKGLADKFFSSFKQAVESASAPSSAPAPAAPAPRASLWQRIIAFVRQLFG